MSAFFVTNCYDNFKEGGRDYQYCFMILCYSKVNDIKGPAVFALEIRRFMISLLQILLFYIHICFEREKREKEKQT